MQHIVSFASQHHSTSITKERYLLKRLRLLHITEADIAHMSTVGEVQQLAKAKYRMLAKQHHPDIVHDRLPRYAHLPQKSVGVLFQKITHTYDWLMALDPARRLGEQASVPLPDIPQPLRPEYDLPNWAQRRPYDLGYGWQEAWDQYWH